MAYGVKLKVWGDYASFNRPEMKVERVSYDVMTPSAARGILEAIYWKPEMRWVIDKIHVINPIRFTHVRRNEVSCKIPVKGATGVNQAITSGEGNLGITVEQHRQQRAAMILKDVCYGIEAHIDILKAEDGNGKSEAKHLDIFNRRAAKGRCFHHPYLGCREFPASFELVDELPGTHAAFPDEKDLGFMLHDLAFIPDEKGKIVEANQGRRLTAVPRFFRAVMKQGVIVVPPLESARA